MEIGPTYHRARARRYRFVHRYFSAVPRILDVLDEPTSVTICRLEPNPQFGIGLLTPRQTNGIQGGPSLFATRY